MLSYGNNPTCQLCGGKDAPIIDNQHLNIKYCAEYLARDLLSRFVKAHEKMLLKPDYFSKSNPTKQSYYGMLNDIVDRLEKSYLTELQLKG